MENTYLKKVEMSDEHNFTAIDFETDTGKRASICEVSICVVRCARLYLREMEDPN